MSYQKITGPLMANSHPGSYCGQDAYSDMLVTEKKDERIFMSSIRLLQGNGSGVCSETEGLQRRNGSDFEGGGTQWIAEILQKVA